MICKSLHPGAYGCLLRAGMTAMKPQKGLHSGPDLS
jgi:hypothetical protein